MGCGPRLSRRCRARRPADAPAMTADQIESVQDFLAAGGSVHAAAREAGLTAEQLVLAIAPRPARSSVPDESG
eukprot:6433913-Lingulodinium_polyedra.AAC.1